MHQRGAGRGDAPGRCREGGTRTVHSATDRSRDDCSVVALPLLPPSCSPSPCFADLGPRALPPLLPPPIFFWGYGESRAWPQGDPSSGDAETSGPLRWEGEGVGGVAGGGYPCAPGAWREVRAPGWCAGRPEKRGGGRANARAAVHEFPGSPALSTVFGSVTSSYSPRSTPHPPPTLLLVPRGTQSSDPYPQSAELYLTARAPRGLLRVWMYTSPPKPLKWSKC